VDLEETSEKTVTNLEAMPFKTQSADLCLVPEMFCGLLFFFCHLLELNDGLLAKKTYTVKKPTLLKNTTLSKNPTLSKNLHC
jgi:hypothetical protein